MKKFLSLAVVCAALAAAVGCDDKKTTATGGAGSKSTPAGGSASSPAGGGAASPSSK